MSRALPAERACYTTAMELRQTTAEESEAFSRTIRAAFHRELQDFEREHFARVAEPERGLAWFDSGRLVAGTTVFTRRLSIPGAIADCAAVTGVGVLPTHRRRGLLTELMRRQLQDIRERREPIAALWASEAGIYGRFGYGPAAGAAHLRARRPAARLAAPPPPGDPLLAGPAADHVEHMRAVHEREREHRPGLLDRDGPWWQSRLFDPEPYRDGAQQLQAVVTEDGYALYAVKTDFTWEGPAGEVRVRELVASTPRARARLWGFLLDQDLTTTVTWDLAPVDEPLALMVTDPRAVSAQAGDGLWVRLVDVAGALGARRYVGSPDVVLDVSDPFCPWNEGRFSVRDGGCERTKAQPDLALDVSALGAAYLGATTLRELAAAGRVDELRPGALQRASRALRGDVAAWCPEIF
jgi:predicted acetyltransferase